jgi:hypothetical protein
VSEEPTIPQRVGLEIMSKTLWGGIIANGAALVALTNVTANVRDPDAALKALTPTLMLLTLAVICGLRAATATGMILLVDDQARAKTRQQVVVLWLYGAMLLGPLGLGWIFLGVFSGTFHLQPTGT